MHGCASFRSLHMHIHSIELVITSLKVLLLKSNRWSSLNMGSSNSTGEWGAKGMVGIMQLVKLMFYNTKSFMMYDEACLVITLRTLHYEMVVAA